jgi:ribosomal protein S18 acetylase RimI-like enzyme
MTTIRRAFDADADGIRRVARAAWHDAYDSLDSDVIDETISDWYADPLGSALHGWAGGVPANDLDDIEATLLVAEQDGEIIGFTQGITMHTMGTMLRLYVHPDYHGEGVGTALYDRLEDIFLEHGVEQFRALDLASNDRSREFFENLGFERIKTRTLTLGGDPYDEAVYSRELSPEDSDE